MNKISEKAVSKQQQKLMGLVHALQKGTVKPGKASKAAKAMAKSMDPEDVKDFAATKHKGLPKKVKKENMGVASMYVVRKPHADMKEADLVMELNPLEGIQPLNIEMTDVHSVHATAEDAQAIAAEAYKSCMDEAHKLEEKKGKVGDKLKKAIDQLEKKRKEHVDMAKEDPKSASKHKEHIAKIAAQIDDLMSKMEKIEKSKKDIGKKEDKKPLNENTAHKELKPLEDILLKNGYKFYKDVFQAKSPGEYSDTATYEKKADDLNTYEITTI